MLGQVGVRCWLFDTKTEWLQKEPPQDFLGLCCLQDQLLLSLDLIFVPHDMPLNEVLFRKGFPIRLCMSKMIDKSETELGK